MQNSRHFVDSILVREKIVRFDVEISLVYSYESKWQHINIGSGYGLVLNWQDADAWTKMMQFNNVYMYHRASANELIVNKKQHVAT